MIYILNPFEDLHTFFCESLLQELPSSRHIQSIHNALSIAYENNDIIIYVIHPLYILKNQDCKILFQKIHKTKSKAILYVSEPLTLLFDRHAYQQILHTYPFWQIWTYTQSNVNLLKSMLSRNLYLSSNIYYVPPNPSSTYYAWIDQHLILSISNYYKRKDKIVWIGNMTPSRQLDLLPFGDQLIHFTNVWKKEEWIQILKEYQYFINIHRIPKCQCFETFRIVPIITNGGVVISEEINEKEMKEWSIFPIFFGKRDELYNLWKKIQNNNYSYPTSFSFPIHYKKILNLL